MKQERRTFDPSFKNKAVELSGVRGNTKQVAEELGIEAHLIYRWKKEFSMNDSNSFSIVCPVFNEKDYIDDLLIFLGKVSPSPDEIFFIDGMSTDGTRAIIEKAIKKWPKIQLISNPDKLVPFALNLAIPLCTSNIIVRLDVHTKYAEDYFARILATFEKVDADIVGGPTRTAFKSPFQEAVAHIFNTPLGMGNSSVHNVEYNGYTDSVTFGAWKKEMFENTGLFDTRLKRNQDDEFHYRAKSMGFKIYQNSDIKLWYYPRNNWNGLFKQYFQYGLYKPVVLFKIKSALSIRHLVPSFLVLYSLSLIVISFLRPILLMPILIYFLLILIVTLNSRSSIEAKMFIPFAFIAVHFGYGLGFILGCFKVLNTYIYSHLFRTI